MSANQYPTRTSVIIPTRLRQECLHTMTANCLDPELSALIRCLLRKYARDEVVVTATDMSDDKRLPKGRRRNPDG